MNHRRDMDRSLFAPEPAFDPAPQSWATAASGTRRKGAKRSAGERASFRRFGRACLALGSLCLLAGCVDTYASTSAPQTQVPPPANEARRPGVSPGGATVAMASFSGSPTTITTQFTGAFDGAARAQGIVMTDPEAADYLVRTYLNAVPDGDGTAVTYVLDVFNSKKQRTQRIEDEVRLKAKAADPWSVVDNRVLAAVAAKSAAELAAVLTNTPEAIVASAHTTPAAAVAATSGPEPASGRTVVAATPPVGPPGSTSSASAGGIGAVALH